MRILKYWMENQRTQSHFCCCHHTIHNSQFAKNNNSTCQKRRNTQIVWHNTPAAFSIWPINGWQNFLLFCLFADLLFFFLQGGRMSETNLHVGKRMYQYLWLSFSQIQIKPAWYQTEQYSNSSSSIYSVLFLCVRNFFTFLPRSLNTNGYGYWIYVYVAQNMATSIDMMMVVARNLHISRNITADKECDIESTYTLKLRFQWQNNRSLWSMLF